jgi:hypothetical protein
MRLLESATREPRDFVDDDPVFTAGLGWRTGSTLVQRALMTDPSILVWGEPLDRILFIDHLTEALTAITDEWPLDDHWLSHRGDVDLVRDWVATLAPDAGHLKAGYRAFYDHWLATPAHERGFKRWGAKQVRWSGAHATALRWLYPRCHLLLVVRHPVSAYVSLRNAGFEPPAWGEVVRWPDRWISSLDDYARYWNELALSWGAIIEKLGVIWFRYEDLVEGRVDLDAIGASLGLKMSSEIAFATRAGQGLRQTPFSAEERDRINELTVQGRALFTYAN